MRRMETFSATIRQKHSRGNRCEDIDSAIAKLQARKVAEIDGYLLSPVSSIPSKAADLLQLGTRRSVDLAESAIREMNREALNSSCILTRAVLETGCLMLYISHQVRHAVKDPAKADLDKLNTFMMDTLVGSGPKAKTFIFKEGHRVTNILTIMEKLDRELETPFLGFYEGLSEHSHPNAHGMALTVRQYAQGMRDHVHGAEGVEDAGVSRYGDQRTRDVPSNCRNGEPTMGRRPAGVYPAPGEEDSRGRDVAGRHPVSAPSTKRRHVSNKD